MVRLASVFLALAATCTAATLAPTQNIHHRQTAISARGSRLSARQAPSLAAAEDIISTTTTNNSNDKKKEKEEEVSRLEKEMDELMDKFLGSRTAEQRELDARIRTLMDEAKRGQTKEQNELEEEMGKAARGIATLEGIGSAGFGRARGGAGEGSE